jgi:hypothetical protein
MKPSLHSTVLLISTSVLLLAPLSGLCFYNPATGCWLNRDRLGENPNANVYAFVGNDSVNSSDMLGDYKLPVDIYDNVDKSYFGKDGLAQFLAPVAGGIDPGTRTSCTCPKSKKPGYKLVGMKIDVRGAIEFKKGHTHDEKPKGYQHTLLQHEQIHASNYEFYITQLESVLTYLNSGVCFTPLCFNAWNKYYYQYLDPLETKRNALRDAELDCSDYKGDCDKIKPLTTEVNTMVARARAALKLVNSICAQDQ